MKKQIEIEITQEMCDEINKIAKDLGLDKFPDWKEHKPSKIKALFG